MSAGEEIFARQGAETIADRAGVAIGSRYNHFGSKAGRHAAVIQRALGVDRNYMDRANE